MDGLDALFVYVCATCRRQVTWEQRDRLSYGWFHGNVDGKCERGQYLAPNSVERIEVIPKEEN